MKKQLTIKVSKKHYFEVLNIVDKYAFDTIAICSYDNYNEIKLVCSKLKVKQILKKLESVKASLLKVEVGAK